MQVLFAFLLAAPLTPMFERLDAVGHGALWAVLPLARRRELKRRAALRRT